MPETPNDVVRAHGNVRGTQSFVHVMASIFKRPGLVAVEIAWRILAWLGSYGLVGIVLGSFGMDIRFTEKLDYPISLSNFWQTVPIPQSLLAALSGTSSHLFLLIAAATSYWAILSVLGRSIILRKLGAHSGNWLTLTVLGLSRVWLFALFVGTWVLSFSMISRHFVAEPTARGEYPSYVPGFALFTIITLVLFMLWSITSWIFPLATTFAMSKRLTIAESLRAAWNHRLLRSKVIEINLVMAIVKVALLVLAMVFSACPLPFSNVATQQFLNWWWFGCFLFWVIASDYFHVVRAAAVLRLTQAYNEA